MIATNRAAPFVLALLLAGCGGGGSGNQVESPAGGLTGRYQAGGGPRPAQLCLVEREGGPASFGLVAWGQGDANCSAGGSVRREGDRLRLQFDGDDACTLDARVEGGRVSLAGTLGGDCARYYCGPGATLDALSFERAGEGVDEARRVTDLAGDPLCGA